MRPSDHDDDVNTFYQFNYHGINVNDEVNYDGQEEFSNFNDGYLYNSNALFSSSFDQLENPQTIPHRDFTEQDIGVEEKSDKRIGLQLTASPSFLNSLDKLLSSPSGSSHGKKKRRDSSSSTSSQADHEDFPSPDKLKAANFPALALQIGSWKRKSRYEGDLVAKCYFKKRKLVWEALDGNLKVKIEFQWSDISAINAKYLANGQGILDIMLKKGPLFFHEVNPQPRKHTNWEQCEDFTDNNQASLVRRHTLEFAPGILEKQYEKLMQADPILQKLSQQPFPYQASPYFEQIQFSNEFYYNNPLMNTVMNQFPGMGFSSHMSNYPNELVARANYSDQLDPYLNQVQPDSSCNQTSQLHVATSSVADLGMSNHLAGYQLPCMNDSMVNVEQPISYALPQDYAVSTQMISEPISHPHSSSLAYDGIHQSSLDYQQYHDYNDGRYQWL